MRISFPTLCCLLLATELSAQVQLLNPQSYPASVTSKSVQIMEDGSAIHLAHPLIIHLTSPLALKDSWQRAHRAESYPDEETKNFKHVHCFSHKHCWAWHVTPSLRYDFEGYESRDSGKTWYYKDEISATHNFDPIPLLDSLHFFIQRRIHLLATRNGGQTFDTLKGLRYIGKTVDTLFMTNHKSDSLWAWTRNGQKHFYHSITLPDSNDIVKVVTFPQHRVYSSSSGRFYSYTRGGQLDTTLYDEGYKYYWSFRYFKRGDTLVRANEDEAVYTYNGGQSWQRLHFPVAFENSQLSFYHAQSLFFTAGNGNFIGLKLSNGDTFNLGHNPYPNLIYLAPFGRDFLAYSQKDSLLHILNRQGQAKGSFSIPFPVLSNSILFKDSLLGMMQIASPNRLAFTNNGGQTWSVEPNTTPMKNYFKFAEKSNCLFASDFTSLYLRQNGHWQNLANFARHPGAPRLEHIRDFYFQSCDTGWVLTNYHLYYTTDGQSFTTLTPSRYHLSGNYWRLYILKDQVFVIDYNSIYYSPQAGMPVQFLSDIGFYTQQLYFLDERYAMAYSPNYFKLILIDMQKHQRADIRFPIGNSLAMHRSGEYSLLMSGLGGSIYRIDDYRALIAASNLAEDDPEFSPQGTSVYPNPCKEYFQLQIPAERALQEVQLFNLKGRRLHTWSARENYTVPNLPAGLYLLQFHYQKHPSHFLRLSLASP